MSYLRHSTLLWLMRSLQAAPAAPTERAQALPQTRVSRDELPKLLLGPEFDGMAMDATWLDRLDMGFDFSDIDAAPVSTASSPCQTRVSARLAARHPCKPSLHCPFLLRCSRLATLAA